MTVAEDTKIITVNGLEIRPGSIYKVTNKPDPDAPSGFVREGTTKLPSANIGNSVPCRYVITNQSTKEGIYDTGFYVDSPCYGGMDKKKAQAQVDILQEMIVKPYERLKGPGRLDHMNEEFWDTFTVDLRAGRFMATDNIENLLDLYIATRSYELTPKSELGDSRFNQSQYCIEDKKKVRNIRDERAEHMMDAITDFGIMLRSDKTLLFSLLRYVGLLADSITPNEKTIKTAFQDWLNKSEQNVGRFNRAHKIAVDPKKKETLIIYDKLKALAKTGIVSKNGGTYNFNGTDLGSNLKEAAGKIAVNKTLKSVKVDLFETE